MPIPYLFCGYTSYTYDWHTLPELPSDTIELGGFLSEWVTYCLNDISFLAKEPISQFMASRMAPNDVSRNTVAPYVFLEYDPQTKFTVSFEYFLALDEVQDVSTAHKFVILKSLVEYTQYLVKHGNPVGINFSEVLLDHPEQVYPEYYRAGIDRVFTDIAEYRKAIDAWSYQFCKMFMIQTIPARLVANESIWPPVSIYSGWANVEPTPNALSRAGWPPLFYSVGIGRVNEVQNIVPNQCLTHPFEIKLALSGQQGPQLILRLGAHWSLSDFEYCARSLASQTALKELIIIFHGTQYQDAELRAEVLRTLERWITTYQWKFFPHVFLLTQPTDVKLVSEFQPGPKVQAGFRALQNNCGYYGSEPRIGAAVWRQIQAQGQENTIPLRTLFADTANTQSQSSYRIHAGPPTTKYRASKQSSLEQLRNQLTFTVTQHVAQARELAQDLQQQHVLQNEQELTQITSQQQQPHTQANWGAGLFRTTVGMSEFNSMLQMHAINTNARPTADVCMLRMNGQYTNHAIQTNLMARLAADYDFRGKVTGAIFKRFAHNPGMCGLRHHSFVQIDKMLAEELIRYIPWIMDGLNPEHLLIEKGFHLSNMTSGYRSSTLVGCTLNYQESKPVIHTGLMNILAHSTQGHFNSVLQTDALLRSEDIPAHSEEDYSKWQGIVQELLTLMQPGCPERLADEPKIRQYLHDLFKVHCPNNSEILSRFLDSFSELRRDHCKIILHLIMMGYRHHLDQFVLLLNELDRRALLEHFRKIYFEYAQTITSVSDLLQTDYGRSTTRGIVIDYLNPGFTHELSNESRSNPKQQHLFLELMQNTPIGSTQSEWPPFIKFTQHFLLFSSRLNIDTHHLDLRAFQKFWQSLDNKIFKYYAQDRARTDQAMATWVDHLICAYKGLKLEPVGLAKTIFNGLEQLIDNAIRHDTLLEQLMALPGLSLLAGDAPYLAMEDGFEVVTQDAEPKLSKLRHFAEYGDTFHVMDQFVSSYRVTEQELKAALHEQYMMDAYYPGLTSKIFRYLGALPSALREPISFYRQLLKNDNQFNNTVNYYFNVLLVGYFVLTKTGPHYVKQIDRKALHHDFMAFIRQKNYALPYYKYDFPEQIDKANQSMRDKIAGEYRPVIDACIHDFFVGLDTITIDQAHNNHYCLWDFYVKSVPAAAQSSGFLSLVGFNSNYTLDTIPAVFKKKFSIHHVAGFFLTHQEELQKSANIFVQYPEILDRLLVAKIREEFAATVAYKQCSIAENDLLEKKRYLYDWFKYAYPQLRVLQFKQNSIDFERLVKEFSEFALQDDYEQFLPALHDLLCMHTQVKHGLRILDLIAEQRHLDEYTVPNMVQFLQKLHQFPELLIEDSAYILLSTLCTAYLRQPQLDGLVPRLRMTRNLIGLDATDALKALQILLSHLPTQQAEEDMPFFLQQPLTGQQLQSLADVLAYKPLPLDVLAQIYQDDSGTDFADIYAILQDFDAEQSRAVGDLARHIYSTSAQPMARVLLQLSTQSKSTLVRLARLLTLYLISPQRVLEMLNSSNLRQSIKTLEQELYAENLERFIYDAEDIKQKIAQIRKKSLREEAADEPLSDTEQRSILRDYRVMMSYMQENPVLIEVDSEGTQCALSIQQLDEEQFQTVYQRLKTQLMDTSLSTSKRHAYRLSLLALCIEAHYRMTKKFPQNTQILCHLHALHNPESLIQEVKTGGGKSIISELAAVTLCAENWTVDIATENDALANVSLKKFKSFYQYLGVPYAKETIQPNSAHAEYVEFGINHGTPANFSFFRIQMALKKKILPKRVALLCDEIDAILTTTIQYRLAGVLDPMYADLRSWAVVLSELLEFVKEEEIYLNNRCDEQDDVENFKLYFSTHQDKKLTKFVDRIPTNTLDKLLNSARMPQALEAGVDYLAILKSHMNQPKQYAAPIMNVGTKRPEPGVSYSDGVQQLLHLARNGTLAKGELPFLLDAITETLVIISAKNFFDYYVRIIGWTGSPGAKIELQEYLQDHGLSAYYYPVFHPDRSENLGTMIVSDRTQKYAIGLARMCQQRLINPGQPVVMFEDSPKRVAELRQYLQENAPDLLLQSYDGYEGAGVIEHDVIVRSGEENRVSLLNLALSRGTDFPKDLLAINFAADITESERIQIEGRVARNGALGQFMHIIDEQDLDPATVDIGDPSTRFKAHQQGIALKRQRERLKTRVLENLRYYIVTEYFLKLRIQADRILMEQYGLYATLIPEKTFLHALRDFNQQAEQSYFKHLGTQTRLEPLQQGVFMDELVAIYQTQLNRMVAEHDLQTFTAVEPLIPLAELNALPVPQTMTLQHITAISTVLASGWRAAGHQCMVEFLEFGDVLLAEFQPYFNQECSIRVATAQVLERREILKIPKILAGIDETKDIVSAFHWEDAVTGIREGIDTSEERMAQAASAMIAQIFTPDIISRCKEFVVSYLDDTRVKISEKRWDDLALPDLNVPWIQAWLSTVQGVFRVFSYLTWGAAFVAGPIPFILTRFVFPTVFSWLKTLVKRLFADSQSTLVQVLIGLDDVFADLTKAVTLLFNKDHTTLTIGELTQNILPLFKNKAIQLLLNKLGEFEDAGPMAALYTLIPDITQALEPYQDLLCTELKKPEIIMTVVMKVLQSDLIKPMMDAEEYASMMQNIQALPPDFVANFTDCTLPQLMTVFKIFAHPRFHQLLTQLPTNHTFRDLVTWLHADNVDFPPDIQTPIRELRDYQNNHERIAQEAQHTYRNMKQTFTLRTEDLQAHIASLVHRPNIVAAPVSATFWTNLHNIQWLKLGVAYVCVLLANYWLFSFGTLFATAMFGAVIVVPTVYEIITQYIQDKAQHFPEGIIPPFLSLPSKSGVAVGAAVPQASKSPSTLFYAAMQRLIEINPRPIEGCVR